MENYPDNLFMIGNKRSGTSLLTRLINFHPEIFMAHEADAIWILYQLTMQVPLEKVERYPWDGEVGLQATRKACGDIFSCMQQELHKPGKVRETFIQVLQRLMSQGSDIQKPYQKSNPAWIGDKKPPQQVDPDVFAFILKHFPEARFIHLVRHPGSVVDSMSRAAQTWKAEAGPVGFWGQTTEQVLERWAIIEESVLSARELADSRIYTLKFEDLCANPQKTLKDVFSFVSLDLPDNVAELACQEIKPAVDAKHSGFVLPKSERADAIMKLYGYTR